MDFKTKMIKEEYEAQFFGFTSSDVTEGVKQILEIEITSSANSMKGCVIKQCNNDKDVEQVNLATNSIISEYKNIIADETNIMKGKINTILKIPPHVLLPPDECQEEQFTAEEEQEINTEMEELEKRFKRATYMQFLLKRELEQCDISEIEKRVDEMEKWDCHIEEEKNNAEEYNKLLNEIVKQEKYNML